MKKIVVLSLICLIHLNAGSQIHPEYRSAVSGSWTDPATWEILIGGIWQSATQPPDSLVEKIFIRTEHSVSTNTTITARNLSLAGKLLIDANVSVRLFGAGNAVLSGGIITNKGYLRALEQPLQFHAGARYVHEYSLSEGFIPTASWDPESTLEITGFSSHNQATESGNWSQSFGNVIWNTPNLVSDFFLNGLLNNIRGTLTIKNTNNQVLRFTTDQSVSINIKNNLELIESARFSVSRTGSVSSHVSMVIGGDFNYRSDAAAGSRICEQGTSTINISGHFNMDRGTLYFSSGSGGTSSAGADLKVAGNVSFTGGTIDASIANSNRVGDLFFNGTREQRFVSSGSIIGVFNYRLVPGSVVRVSDGQSIRGNSFECNSCTLITESTDPAGAIQKSATGGGSIRVRSQSWSTGSVIIYQGSGRQYIGSDHPQQSGITTLIDNAMGVETSSSGSGIIVGGNLEILRGSLLIQKNNLTVKANLNTYGGPVLLSSVNLTSARTLTVDGELLLTGSGERLKVESSNTTNAANAVLVLNGNLGGVGSMSFSGPNSQLIIGGVTRTLRRSLPVINPFQLEQLTLNAAGTNLVIDQALTLGNFTAATNSWTGGLFAQAGRLILKAPLVVRSVTALTAGQVDFSNQEIELRRNIQTNWPSGVFISNDKSVMRVTSNFSGIDNTLAFMPGRDTLGVLVLDRSANVQAVGGLPVTPHLKLNSPLTISRLLELKDGEFYHQYGLNLLRGSTLVRTTDAAFSSSTVLPPFGDLYRVVYKDGIVPGGIVAGIEVRGSIKSLLSDLSGELLVKDSIFVRDSLSVIRGVVTLDTDSLRRGVIELTGLLDVRPGSTVNVGNGQLILRSNSIFVGGRVGVLKEGSAINGRLTLEQFMPARGAGFRYISAPVVGARFSELSDDLFFSPGLLYSYHEPAPGNKNVGWIGGLSMESELKTGLGYLIWPWWGSENRDNRWDMTGPIVRGDVDMAVRYTTTGSTSSPDDGWNLLGNPYPSPVYWSLDPSKWSDGAGAQMKNVGSVVYVRDASGKNRTWDAATGIGDLSEGAGIIPTGSAFWVHASGPEPRLVIHENAKASSGGIFYRKAEEVIGGMRLMLKSGSDSVSCFLLSRLNTTPAYDRGRDGILRPDTVLAISIRSADGFPLVHYSSESFPKELDLVFSGLRSGLVSLSAIPLKGKNGFHLWLKDKKTGLIIDLAGKKEAKILPEDNRYILLTEFPTEDFHLKEEVEAVHIYPNPVVDRLTVSVLDESEIRSIKILNIDGQVLLEGIPEEDEKRSMKIDLDITDGLYIVMVNTNEKIIRKKIFVKK